MSNVKYLDLVADVLSEKGALVQVGGRYNAQQKEYAMHIAKSIDATQSMAFCEASTGIGKSIGYLIPSLIYLSLRPDSFPIVISTHTRALQRQLIDKDVPLATEAIKAQGLDVPSVAFRMGRQAFFSPTRVDDFINGLPESAVTAQHKELARFSQASVVSGSGLWMDYIDKYGAFPKGMSADDVCLLDLMRSDNPAYEHHIEAAKHAQLLITNHATVLNREVFKNRKFHAVICDEAHEIEDVCKDLATYKSQLKRIASAIRATDITTASATKACDLAETLADTLLDFDADNGQTRNLVSDISHASLLHALQPDVLSLQKLTSQVRTKYASKLDEAPTHKQAKVVDTLDRHIKTLKAFDLGSQHNQRRAVAFSEKFRDPSIASISLSAGRLFSYQTSQLTSRVALVSATMSNANAKETSFTQMMNALGINEDQVTDTCSIAPKHFGKMSFVVVESGDSPISLIDNEVIFDKKWTDSTAAMIDLAAKSGKTLVLSPSIQESKMLAKKINSDYLLQDANHPLMQLTKPFIEGDEPVLLSAGAWNGVSFRATDGGQLLQNIVITRIPFFPQDDATQFLQREYLLSKGYTESAIKGIYWTAVQYQTMIKLKQGIGRGLRSPTDVIKVWFADPRMPTQKKSSGLIAAIPRRFLDDYYNAPIFDGKEVVKPKPVFFL